MCLNTITKSYSPPDRTERKAYKILQRSDGGELRSMFQYYRQPPFRFGQWVDAVAVMAYTENYSGAARCDRLDTPRVPYMTGFHAIASLEQAKLYINYMEFHDMVIAEVTVSHVTHAGTDGSSDEPQFLGLNIETLVAQRMRLDRVIENTYVR